MVLNPRKVNIKPTKISQSQTWRKMKQVVENSKGQTKHQYSRIRQKDRMVRSPRNRKNHIWSFALAYTSFFIHKNMHEHCLPTGRNMTFLTKGSPLNEHGQFKIDVLKIHFKKNQTHQVSRVLVKSGKCFKNWTHQVSRVLVELEKCFQKSNSLSDSSFGKTEETFSKIELIKWVEPWLS